jgi:putative addiction module component (TIGR02574 family)
MAALLTESQVAKLSVEERMRLIELIWRSFAPDDLPVPDWHREVIEQRLQRIQDDPRPGTPWSEVRDELRRKREADAKPDR